MFSCIPGVFLVSVSKTKVGCRQCFFPYNPWCVRIIIVSLARLLILSLSRRFTCASRRLSALIAASSCAARTRSRDASAHLASIASACFRSIWTDQNEARPTTCYKDYSPGWDNRSTFPPLVIAQQRQHLTVTNAYVYIRCLNIR